MCGIVAAVARRNVVPILIVVRMHDYPSRGGGG